jgi:16S rRNA (uracil1498-N3)-methyltransferase
MARYRSFLFPEASVEAGVVVLDPRESHHLVRVLRATVGVAVEVLDGKGTRLQTRMMRADAKAAALEIESAQSSARLRPAVTLVQSIPKGKTMDLILRMATEIGAARVQPVFTDQGEVQIKGERLTTKVEKWRATMIESCKQCGLAHLPELCAPVPLAECLEKEVAGGSSLRIVASLEPGSRPLREVLEAAGDPEEVLVAVGPEGDFSPGEYSALRRAGFESVRLGANVLRAETAAAYILSVVDQCAKSVRNQAG